jgi:5-methylcytosine-specific restriction enzyme A
VPVRPCLDCGALTKESRCPEHKAAAQRRRDEARGSAAERGYDSAWQRVRAHVLERDGHRCYYCGAAANTVDHLVPFGRGGARLDPANLVAACRFHNSSKGNRPAPCR